jgi:type I restriction enzyme M protein
MNTPALPHLSVLLSILADHPQGLAPEELLVQLKDRGVGISRPTLNRILVQGRNEGKLVASGLTTGRTYRLAQASDVAPVLPASAQAPPAPAADIVSAYGSKIWSTADVLRGVGIKQSEWPTLMMPFFALMLLESRVRQLRQRALDKLFAGGKTFDGKNPDHLANLLDYYNAYSPSTNNTHHKSLLLHDEGLAKLVEGGPSNLEGRLATYLNGFDSGTQQLLGFAEESQEKFLGIKVAIKALAAKGSQHLFEWCNLWSKVDLIAYDSSAITTLEEHIKRRWADISADTAGEHYTPHDLIALVAEIADDYFTRHPPENNVLSVYDPTCGGGNMLFGVADHLSRSADKRQAKVTVKTYGQEINDTLYALAAVESRFRQHSDIRYGNTLTADQFPGQFFNCLVANPPYGVDWKGSEKAIRDDASGRFAGGCLPPVSDGQHLFLQHNIHHLVSLTGLAFVFCSGSTLFSGDAGGGESNARVKYFQADDNVLGIIQLPKEEFFNTGINTYLWIFSKSKPAGLKDRAFFLDASALGTRLRKSLGSKRNELNAEARELIVKLMREAELNAATLAPSDVPDEKGQLAAGARGPDGRRALNVGLALRGTPVTVQLEDPREQPSTLRLLATDEVCYNRLELELTRGQPALLDTLAVESPSVLILPQTLTTQDARHAAAAGTGLRLSSGMDIDTAMEAVAHFEAEQGIITDVDDRIQEFQADPRTLVGTIKALLQEGPVRVDGALAIARDKGARKTKGKVSQPSPDHHDFLAWNIPGQPQDRTLYEVKGQEWRERGRAAMTVATKIKAGKNDEPERLVLDLGFGPDVDRDSETVPFSSHESLNKVFQDTFLDRWVKDPYVILDKKVGCEVNFNRLFPKSGDNKTVAQVEADIAALDAELLKLRQGGQ